MTHDKGSEKNNPLDVNEVMRLAKPDLSPH